MKGIILAVVMMFSAVPAMALTDNSIPCADLIGHPEKGDFWECISRNGASGYDNSIACSELVGTPYFWECIARNGASALATSNQCSELVKSPADFWECVSRNSP